ncbi:MAG: DUF4199 domain-containing protein [Taibaiella sp.]|nr:DUF4199 domain-containing protein [Taibaiella sp.]
MEQATSAALTTAERNKMAATYGAILGVIYMVLSTVGFMGVSNIAMSWIVQGLWLVSMLILIGIFLKMIRKANGGYLEFREAFGSAFVMLLIAVLINQVYVVTYVRVIDPDVMTKMKDATMRWMEQMKTPDETIDATMERFDKQIADSKTFSVSSALFNYFGSLLFFSLLSLIPCSIVKKPRPIFDNA